MPSHSRTGGGSSFLRGEAADGIFSPEDFSDEQLMIRDLAERFVHEEVLTQQERIEHQEWDVTVSLLRRSAELGLVGIDIPERYGGASLDRVCAMIAAEQMARVPSFAVSFGGQSGIGSLPILYFGSEALRQKYLPLVCSAEKLAAYALSEASSGSDALAAKTRAVLSADGSHWLLSGEKMWVTNAAFADIFITFAQIDGRDFSCFVVDRETAGVSVGAEESKMGLKGSSTRAVAFADAAVPVGNRIGSAGRGHEVALNILNIGRNKLGANAVGLGKTAMRDAVAYAKQRIAFGSPIAKFGAIQHKLAEMATRLWVAEGMVYRTAHLMDRRMEGVSLDDRSAVVAALKEYAVECSIVKVFASEALGYVADEAVQIFGGYGFSSEYPVERYYRDARVFRIFEGTNEINRLMIAAMLLKQRFPATSDTSIVGRARQLFAAMVEQIAAQPSIAQETEFMLADIAIEIYAMDTAMRRAGKCGESGKRMCQTYINDAVARIEFWARQITGTCEFTLNWQPLDTIAARRQIAEALL